MNFYVIIGVIGIISGGTHLALVYSNQYSAF